MSERCTCKWVGEVVETNSTCPIHSIVCTKPLPDPLDERDPVNRCTCPNCAQPERQSSLWALQQYEKIQDFVISNYLFRNSPRDLSHADIVLALAKKALERGRPSPPPTDDIVAGLQSVLDDFEPDAVVGRSYIVRAIAALEGAK